MIILQNIIIIFLYVKVKSISETNKTTNSSNIAVFPFKTFYPPAYQEGLKPFGSKDYYNTIHYSNSYLEVEAGKNEHFQKLSLFFKIDDYIFHLDDNYFNKINQDLICHYSSSLSNSYEVNKSKNIYVADKAHSVYAKEYFKIFSDIDLSKYDIIQMNFYHSIDKLNNISYACGNAGLLYASQELYNSLADVNLISQIRENMENIDVSWTFQYYQNNKDNEYEGLFIIGIESLEKTLNKNELIPVYTKLTGYGSILEWKFSIDELYIGNYYYKINDEEIKINSDIDGFEIPKVLSNKLEEIYFNKYYSSKICEKEIITDSNMVISCYNDKFTEVDINNFPEINIFKYKIGFNFTFMGQELFFKKDKKYFFRMVFNLKETEKDIIVGRMFLKKYQIIFNSDSKCMLFFKNNNKKNIFENNNIKDKNVIINILSYLFIGLLFLFIGIFFGRKYCFRDKKKLANELEDDYSYKSKKNDIKKESKLIEMS